VGGALEHDARDADATINGSVLLIALPDIFRGIHIDPLAPGNTSYLLWVILGFLVVIAVLLGAGGGAADGLRAGVVDVG
jgi:hypothetical protein